MTCVAVTEALGESLSPTQVSTYITGSAEMVPPLFHWFDLRLSRPERTTPGNIALRQ